MIKQLIEDVAFDKIDLSQALTRAKIIAHKVKNDQFKEWLSSEINGYKQKDLPSYRIIPGDLFAEIFVPFSDAHRTIPLDVSNVENNLDLEYSFYEQRVTQSISTLEIGLDKDKKQQYGYYYFDAEFVRLIASMSPDGDSIRAVKRRIQFSQIEHIIQQTKQKLLDTLLELHDAFPNLENEFSNNNYNEKKVETIINHNIYGNYSNSNIGIGNNINQSIDDQKKIKEFVEHLAKLGVPDADIKEVEEIIVNEAKENVGKKLLNWIGKMSTKAVEKGIDSKLPQLIDKIQDFI